jgi:RNA polymerase sigma-70 factor (ECF subfamily)
MFGFKKELSLLSDEALMQLLSTRHCNDALTEIHSRYAKKLLGFFLRMTNGNEVKSQDLVQDLFLRILEKHQLFDSQKRFYSWVYTIASNMVKTSYREKSFVDFESDQKNMGHLVHWSDNQNDISLFHDVLKQAIYQLEEFQRLPFILRYMEELSVKEIAEILEISEGTVKSRLYYATRKIAKALNEFTPEQPGKEFKLS